MARVGTTIDNPIAGESLTFVATCEEGSKTLWQEGLLLET